MIDTLHIFRLVAQQSSFTRAAELAGLTRPAVSQQIKHLEHHFGVDLFVRSTRKVELTPAGNALLVHVERVLSAVEEMETAMADRLAHERAIINVAASTLPGESLLPRVLAPFHAQHPTVEVRTRVANTEAVLQLVRDGQVDLGLVGQAVSDPWLEGEQVAEDEIVLALPPGQQLPDPLPLERLTDVQLVLREPGSATRATVVDALAAHGLELSHLNVVAEFGSPEGLKMAVRSGVGAAFVSLFSLAPGELPFIRVEGLSLKRPICACWPRHKSLSDVQRALVAQLAALR